LVMALDLLLDRKSPRKAGASSRRSLISTLGG
jgi:hypothetical protein